MQLHNLYQGIDIVYYGVKRQLEYDLIVKPGADPNNLRLAFSGVDNISIDGNGDLVLTTPAGQLRQRRPIIYQLSNGVRHPVNGHFVIQSDYEVAFEIGDYDTSRQLVIDPVLAASTYLGGIGSETVAAMALDSNDNIYIAGTTTSTDFPRVGPVQPGFGGTADVFVTKVNAAGTAILYSTYLGGSNSEAAMGLAVDASGSAHVAGTTESSNFPYTPGAYRQSTSSAGSFVAKLTPSGNALVFAASPCGAQCSAAGIAVDSTGRVFTSGVTDEASLTPTPGAIQPVFGGGTRDAFLSALSSLTVLSYTLPTSVLLMTTEDTRFLRI